MASSARYEDLKDELLAVKDKVKEKLKLGITEGTLNNFLSEGDGISVLMKKEVDSVPPLVSKEMHQDYQRLSQEWNQFKTVCRTNPGSIIGGPSLTSRALGRPVDFETNMKMVQGVKILKKTQDSVYRATQVARESEDIGTAVIEELGDQRDALVRTRTRLQDTGHELKRTHGMIKSINRRVATNKCMLTLIIILELGILGGLIYYKFITKWMKKA